MSDLVRFVNAVGDAGLGPVRHCCNGLEFAVMRLSLLKSLCCSVVQILGVHHEFQFRTI